MSVVASLPDLSSVLSYNTQHLTTAASHWENTADQWENTFRQLNTQAQNLPWEGEGADAAKKRTQGDMLVAVNRADRLREAATVARNGASQLASLKKRVVETIQDAQAAGFDIGEDGSMYDRYVTDNAAEEAQRQAMAETFAADLRHRTAALVARDTEVGSAISGHAGDVGTGIFGNYHGNGHVMAVDNNNADDQCGSTAWDAEVLGKFAAGVGGIAGGIAAIPKGNWPGALSGIAGGLLSIGGGFGQLGKCAE